MQGLHEPAKVSGGEGGRDRPPRYQTTTTSIFAEKKWKNVSRVERRGGEGENKTISFSPSFSYGVIFSSFHLVREEKGKEVWAALSFSFYFRHFVSAAKPNCLRCCSSCWCYLDYFLISETIEFWDIFKNEMFRYWWDKRVCQIEVFGNHCIYQNLSKTISRFLNFFSVFGPFDPQNEIKKFKFDLIRPT